MDVTEKSVRVFTKPDEAVAAVIRRGECDVSGVGGERINRRFDERAGKRRAVGANNYDRTKALRSGEAGGGFEARSEVFATLLVPEQVVAREELFEHGSSIRRSVGDDHSSHDAAHIRHCVLREARREFRRLSAGQSGREPRLNRPGARSFDHHDADRLGHQF